MDHHFNSNGEFCAIAGFATVQLSKMLGFIKIENALDTFILGAIGALGGWLMGQLIKFITKKVKQKFNKKP